MKKLSVFLKKTWWLIILLIVLGAYSLWSAANPAYLDRVDMMSSAPQSTEYSGSEEFYDMAVETKNTNMGQDYEQKIIQTGSLSLHVDDVQEAVAQVGSLTEEWGGQILDSSLNRGNSSYSAWMTVRVPSDRFTEAMAGFKEIALYTISENVNAEDVTETYMNLTVRLNNAKAEEAQYLDILKQAKTVEETLQVTQALGDVRYVIESTEAQISYYDARVDYSNIELSLTEDESVSSVTDTWRPIGTVKEAFTAWVAFLQGGMDTVIYAVIYLWPLGVLALLVWLWKRKR